MSKITYNKVRGSNNLLRGAEVIDSVAGKEFSLLHDELYMQIQETNFEYRNIIAHARDIQIGAANAYDNVSIDMLLDHARQLLSDSNQSALVTFQEQSIDVINDILPQCLIPKSKSDIRAKHILLSPDYTDLYNITNITFNQKELAKTIIDLFLLFQGFSDNSAIELIGKCLFVILDLLCALQIRLDDNCNYVLLVLYKNAFSSHGIDEGELIELLSDKISEDDYYKAIRLLYQYKCVDIIDGRIYIIDSIEFKTNNNF